MIDAAATLRDAVKRLIFTEPVTHVYNPLDYAWPMHERYLQRFATGPRRVVFLGMNPGPWGMAQTGIPFGEVAAVRDWLSLDGPIGRPTCEHPKRPVEGLACRRSEVSGRRLWGLFADRYPSADAALAKQWVGNFCPLVFMEASGRNRTPDRLSPEERLPLQSACVDHLLAVVQTLRPTWIVGGRQVRRDAGDRNDRPATHTPAAPRLPDPAPLAGQSTGQPRLARAGDAAAGYCRRLGALVAR